MMMWSATWTPLNLSCGVLITLSAFLLTSPVLAEQDIANTVGADECGECHKKEVESWRATRHYKTFNELSRTDEAKSIAKKMGLRRLKQESDCVSCHFTQREVNGKPKSVSGIACESCHGAAKQWLKVHSDYGGKDVKKEQETKAHREDRIAKIEKAGMIRPEDLYGVANNCYQCHLVPNEKLVNVGGHKAGSPFELVAWSQGEVRHNYFSSASGEENQPASADRKRMMFVLGNALELEHSLRAVGKATEKADYAVKMAKRVKAATARLKKIGTLIKAPEIDEMVKIGSSAKLSLNNGAELNKAADEVGQLARKFAGNYDGGTFSALDKYLPTQFKGQPHG
jgi:hypothetical protein